MENNNYIQFKKERELGEIISATFKFVRENFKPLIKAIIRFVGPAILLLVFALGYYTYSTFKKSMDLSLVMSSANPFGALMNFYGTMSLEIIFLIITAILYYSTLYGTIQYVVKSYIDNKGIINLNEVAVGIKKDWGSMVGMGFIVTILTMLGAMFCVLPGIYLAVVFILVYSIKVFDKLSVSESISYSFSLIKDNWWMTFFTVFIMGILYYIISFIFQLPATIYSILKMFTAAQQGSMADPSSFIDWIYLSLLFISSVFQYITYTIVAVCIVFIYFNLNEKKHHTGTYETIDELGNNE